MPQYLNPNAIEPGSITSEMLNSEVIENIKTQVGGGNNSSEGVAGGCPTIEHVPANTPLQVCDNKIYIFSKVGAPQ